MVKDATYDKQLSGIPLNVEGPVLYYRKDLFQKCGVAVPKKLEELEAALPSSKSCEPGVTPFVSRGLKPALPFTYSVFLHNAGGQYMKDGKSQLCSKEGQASLGLYAKLLKDYGPPGVVNYSFYQISSLYREGKAAMAFESSNELRNVMDGGARLKDTGVAVLPSGAGGSHPTVIGWTMSVSAHSKNKEAAWYFVQWATSPAMQQKLALEGVAPPRASVAKAAGYKQWMDEQPVRVEWATAVDELARTGTSEVGVSDRRQPGLARVHRPGHDRAAARPEDPRPGLRRCRQAARRADRQGLRPAWRSSIFRRAIGCWWWAVPATSAPPSRARSWRRAARWWPPASTPQPWPRAR